MKSNNIDRMIGIIWAISLAFGLIYNRFLSPFTTSKIWINGISEFLVYFILTTISGLVFWWLSDKLAKKSPIKVFLLGSGLFAATVIPVYIAFGMNEMIGNSIVVGFLFAAYMGCINKYIKKPYGMVILMVLMIVLVAIGFLSGRFNMLYLTLAVTFLTLALAIYVYDIKNKKRWYIALLLVSFLVYLASAPLAVFTQYGFETLTGFIDPAHSPNYSVVVNQLKSLKLFNFNLASSNFPNELKYNGSSVYLHIAVMFGIVFVASIIILQLIGVFLMIKRAKSIKDKKRRVFGCMMPLIIGAQLLFSMGSSFCWMPLNNSGVPFISCIGLEYCVIPLLFFLLNIMADNQQTESALDEPEAAINHINKQGLLFKCLELLGLENQIESIEEWKR